MRRLLCITANMNAGGAETFLMKIYRELDRTQFQMDFCVNSNKNKYAEEIASLGGKIYTAPSKSKSPLKAFLAVKNIVKENKYEYVMRVNEHSLSVIDLLAAKCGGAKHLIMRSSNSNSPSKISKALHIFFQFLPKYVPSVKLAPSELAARYTFGNKCVDNNEVHILKNGLNIDLFKFSEFKRNRLREELKVADKFVVGHVGRFNTQKNHLFLLDVFSEIRKLNKNAVLLMVGEGNLETQVRKRAEELEIMDSCIFTGVRNDVDSLLCAMDVFLFPSLYEGMPNTVIEAQVSGLPCVISDTITSECNVSGLVQFISLQAPKERWAECVITASSDERSHAAIRMIQNGYEISEVAEEFCKLIFDK